MVTLTKKLLNIYTTPLVLNKFFIKVDLPDCRGPVTEMMGNFIPFFEINLESVLSTIIPKIQNLCKFKVQF